MKTLMHKKVSSKKAILIEGLPGIGNVGKIAIDYIIEKLKPSLIAEIQSDHFPALVVISEDNLIERPSIKILHKKIATKDYFFVQGDFQPNSEAGTYSLAKQLLEFADNQSIELIITLGGIGLAEQEENPKVLATANNKKTLTKAKTAGADTKIFNKVGTILGVTGLLLGLSKKDAAALLVETTFEPGAYALLSAQNLVKSINKITGLKVNTSEIQKEFEKNSSALEKLEHLPKFEETNYIG